MTWIVIPTYNERQNITNMIPALFELNISAMHVLIVDDSSPDGTAEAVRELQTRHPALHLEIRPKKSGLGRAYTHGFTYALNHGAKYIVQMDADFSHSPSDVRPLLKELDDHDLVLGSRYSQGISVINWPLRRLLLSLTANLYVRLITGMPFKDATGGFKAWRAETLQAIDIALVKADGYGFQIIMTHRAWKKICVSLKCRSSSPNAVKANQK